MDQLGDDGPDQHINLPHGNPPHPPKRVRKPRVGKREVMRRLAEENMELRRMIAALNQQISTVETENTVLSSQLAFFTEQINAQGPGLRGPEETDDADPQSHT
jgi:hypothetical protein